MKFSHPFNQKYAVVQLFAGLILGLITPIMYIVFQGKGLSTLHIGSLIIISAITTMLLEVPFGVIADKYGRKASYLLGQLFMACVFLLIFLYSDFIILTLAMLLQGLSLSLVSGTLDAIFVDKQKQLSDNPDFLQKNLAQAGYFHHFGIFIGAVMSALLSLLPQLHVLTENAEFFYQIAFCLIPIQMLFVSFFIQEVSPQKIWNKVGFFSLLSNTTSQLKGRKTLQYLLFSTTTAVIAYMSFEKFWQLELQYLLGSESKNWLFGVLVALSLLFSMIGQTLSPAYCQLFQHNYAHVLITIRLASGASFFALFLSDSIIPFALCFMLIFFLNALSTSAVMTLFHHSVDDHERTTLLSIRSVFLQLGALGGTLIASTIADVFSLKVAFGVSCLIYFISTLFFFIPVVSTLARKLSQEVRFSN